MKVLLVRIGASLVLAGSFRAAAEEAGPLGTGSEDLRRSTGVQLESAGDSTRNAGAPARVLTAALLADELLLETMPLERWVGVSYVVDWPSATPSAGRFPESLPRTLGTTEDILSHRPELVVLSPYNDALTAAQLGRVGVGLYSLPAPSTFEELFVAWAALGERVGARETSRKALAGMIFAHCSDERGHAALLEHLRARPLLDLGMRLGEASGALAAYPLVEAACALHTQMATFAAAAIPKAEP